MALLLAAGAAVGTLGVAAGVATLVPKAPVSIGAVPVVTAATSAPSEQVVVDTVYVRDPAPTANPEPIVIPAPTAPAAEAQVVRVVRVVAGGEHEGDESHERDHEGSADGESGGDD